MTRHVEYFPTKTHRIEDVIKWIEKNVPDSAHMTGVVPVVELGTNCWKVEYHTGV